VHIQVRERAVKGVVRPNWLTENLAVADEQIAQTIERRREMRQDALKLKIEELEQRIAPDVVGNPGNNNPGENNTNNPGNEGGGGNNNPVPNGATPQPNP
jgi:hypothetical protein